MRLILFLICTIGTLNKCFGDGSPESIRDQQGFTMKSFMNDSINPCDNFYKYACGNWAKRQTIGKDEFSFGVLDVITKKVNKFLEELILFNNYTSTPSEKVQSILKSSEVKKIQNYFSICREQKKLEYEPYIKAWGIPGGWPTLNSTWSNQTFDWLNITAQLKLIESQSLIDAQIAPYYNNATRNTIYILPAEFPVFKPSMYEENPIIKLIISGLISMSFESLGLSEVRFEKIVSDVLAFEIKLASIFPNENEENEEIEDMPLETLQELMPNIDFQRFLNIVSGGVVNKSQEVTIAYSSYFRNLSELINETEPEVLANFFLYRFTLQIGTTEKVEVYCRDEVIDYMGFVLGYVYNMAFNDERDSADVKMIAQNIKSVFTDAVQEINWMDQDTKEEALTKLNNLLLQVGASDDDLLFNDIKEEFALIDLDPNDYYRSYFKLSAFSTRKLFKQLHKINKRTESNYNAAMVNAFYNSARNHIFMPTNILQSPVYNFHFPYSVKYGALGSIMGHEITHSLDATGRAYDSNGTIRSWWTEQSEEEYLNRTQCLEMQYAKYTPSSLKTSANSVGGNTLDENIADNGGLRQSYQAYKDWYMKHPNEQETLPHLNLTNTQLFFLSFAQFYCEMNKPAALLINTLTDEHSLSKNRVIGTLSNFEEFSKEFNCPIGSKMNPAKKCRVW
ncbi:unnamed protein product [Hermetia illucens]|uniref:Fibrillar collagen NC1 domain-containing protein n=1 Tax=Hermetia illucens TaxID=343691 RepID=A0A7R8YWD2_HERIL|nr:neprilysin-4-like [Hermetia illucens]CAD7084705.1 unnamed protein product [Hermetia illucens]